MVFSRKYSEPDQEHPIGQLIGPKVRMTIAAHRATLKEGVDYSQSYAPTVRDASIRVLLAIVAKEDFELCKIDIETFFLWGDLKEAASTPVYMEVPPYFPVLTHSKGKDLVMQCAQEHLRYATSFILLPREVEENFAGQQDCPLP